MLAFSGFLGPDHRTDGPIQVGGRGRATVFVVSLLLLLLSSGLPANQSATRPPKPLADRQVEPGIEELRRRFRNPADEGRIMVRWWWFGPAVTKGELEREMRAMKDAGIGGFEVQPVYPLSLDDGAIKNLLFLSAEFIEALRFVSIKARELGLRMDLTLGSGWPYGGPQVAIREAAGKLRVERVKVPESGGRVPIPFVSAGEQWIGAFLLPTASPSVPFKDFPQLERVGDGSAVEVPGSLGGPQDVVFFIASRTGMTVKRPAVGAEGFVLDHYDRAAIDNYLKTVGETLLGHLAEPPYAVFCDSLEVYNSDWTADLLEEFRRRRGYDLRPHLLALIIDVGPQTADIRHDWGRTLTELLNERFIAPLREWSHRNGTRLRAQAYGIPPAILSSGDYADLPEGEGSQWKVLRASRWASSASHLYGRRVTSSETWTWLHSPPFRATPLDLKAEADRHFLQGINQLIGHGWPYAPESVEYPGWSFYAAAALNDKNPWWIAMPDVALYLQRVSLLLRQGEPANDVALYLPNSDAWAHFSAGRVHMIEALGAQIGPDVVAKVLEAGLNLDFFDDDALSRLGRVEKGTLRFGSNRFRAVILPGVNFIPLETLRKLEAFARSGGVLIATRQLPSAAPGFLATEAEHREVREICDRLFRSKGAPALFVEDESQSLAANLARLVHPDVALLPPSPDIGFVHRTTREGEIYFLANTSNTKRSVTAVFRADHEAGEWWDPISGQIQPAIAKRVPGGTSLSLDLEAYGSRVLVFSKRFSPAAPPSASVLPPIVDISRGWRVSFGAGKETITMESLRSWTEDERTRHFSGLATYEKAVSLPEELFKDGLVVRLELGEGKPQRVDGRTSGPGMQAWLEGPVREAAVVYINDRRAGSVWCPPYALDVTPVLRHGENQIRIIVGNLALNHMARGALPDYRLLNQRYGVRFEPQDRDKIQPVPAGLLGPVRLVPEGRLDKARSHGP